MKYINRNKKQLIIDVPIHKSTTKTTGKNGKVKENIKYIAHIPNEILIFLFEKFKPFDFTKYGNDAEYIDAMINDDEKYFLSFYDQPGKDAVSLEITNYKISSNDGASVTIKKQVTSNSYFFTVSKKVFTDLKNNDNSISSFRYVLDLDFNSNNSKNSIIDVILI